MDADEKKEYDSLYAFAWDNFHEVERLRGLLARIELELKHPQMDGSQVPRAVALCEQRRK